MDSKSETIKRNLEFIYSKRHQSNDALLDPDKVSYRKSVPHIDIDHDSSQKIVFSDTDPSDAEFAFLQPSYACKVYFPMYLFLETNSNPYDYPFPAWDRALLMSKISTQSNRELSFDAIYHMVSEDDIVTLKKRLNQWSKSEKASFRPDWQSESLDIGLRLLRDKFVRAKELQEKLLKTGVKKLVFKPSYSDPFWGVNSSGSGQNHLGKLIEKVREEIRQLVLVQRWLSSHISNDVEDMHQVYFQVKPMTLVKSLDEKGAEASMPLQDIFKPYFIIGKKAPLCDLPLSHFSISRLHAGVAVTSLRQLRGCIVDLASANGTFVYAHEEGYPTQSTDVEPKRLEPFVPFFFPLVRPVTDSSPSLQTDPLQLSFGSMETRMQILFDRDGSNAQRQQLNMKIQSQLSEGLPAEVLRASITPNSDSSSSQLKVFVGNLPKSISRHHLESFFGQCGKVTDIIIPRDKFSGDARGFAFVSFENISQVAQALFRDGDEIYEGQTISIKRASDNEKKRKLEPHNQETRPSRELDRKSSPPHHCQNQGDPNEPHKDRKRSSPRSSPPKRHRSPVSNHRHRDRHEHEREREHSHRSGSTERNYDRRRTKLIRNHRNRSNSNSPPRHHRSRNSSSRSSPPRRHRSRENDISRAQRRQHNSSNAPRHRSSSPARREESNSPPRRRNTQLSHSKEREASQSRSPPRRRKSPSSERTDHNENKEEYKDGRDEQDISPPRRRKRLSSSEREEVSSPSRSPPRRRKSPSSASD